MAIIAETEKENNQNEIKGFWLHFYLQGSGAEFLDHDLPYPSYLKHYGGKGESYAIGWLIEGFFGTKKGEEFLNDIIARFLLTFREEKAQRLPYKPDTKDNTAHILAKAYKLRQFSTRLKSISKKKKIPQRAEMFQDLVFWAIKLFAEDLIRDYGFIPYQQLEDFALDNFLWKKDRSTLRAKCRNVWNYYEAKEWELPKEKKYSNNEEKYRGTRMTRTENITRVNKQRAEEKKRKILNTLTGMFAEDYKKKNGSWNISKIAKDLGLSINTVKKYISEI